MRDLVFAQRAMLAVMPVVDPGYWMSCDEQHLKSPMQVDAMPALAARDSS